MASPVVMYGCDSWTVKKTEHLRTGDFELWCWRRFLKVAKRVDLKNSHHKKKIVTMCDDTG